MTNPKVTRRQIIKGAAAVGALGAVGIPSVAFAEGDDGDGSRKTFHFAALGGGGTVDDTVHTLVLAGDGKFSDAQVEGGGVFNHVNLNPSLPLPKPVLASGTWKAKRLISFDSIGSSGETLAGILKMDIDVIRLIPSPGVFPAHLQIVCNIPFAGLFTGHPEGFTLTGLPVSFSPLNPTIGITIFGAAVEERD
jgi:TAT (twin-arginine translocation) pathway-exported protein